GAARPGDGGSGGADARARPRRLVHLAEHKRAFRTRGRAIVLPRVLVHAGLDHRVIEVVAFARALADTREHRIAAVRLRHVVDQLHDQDGLADAGPTDQAELAALAIQRDTIDDLACG